MHKKDESFRHNASSSWKSTRNLFLTRDSMAALNYWRNRGWGWMQCRNYIWKNLMVFGKFELWIIRKSSGYNQVLNVRIVFLTMSKKIIRASNFSTCSNEWMLRKHYSWRTNEWNLRFEYSILNRRDFFSKILNHYCWYYFLNIYYFYFYCYHIVLLYATRSWIIFCNYCGLRRPRKNETCQSTVNAEWWFHVHMRMFRRGGE